MVTSKLFQQFLYWGSWLIIPFIWEILMGVISSAAVFFSHYRKNDCHIEFYPRVTILIPLYNSRDTLQMCLESVLDQEYPTDRLEVFLIDNGSNDGSYEVFTGFQERHPGLKIWMYRSEQGKSKALNKGIFASQGKYVINIDSDGCLDREAVKNIVAKFESNGNINCMTGVVLTDPALINKSQSRLMKLVRMCELFEYSESFLVGRNFQSMTNSLYTLAGAFSCFRREALLKTQMYNSETLGEDAHMTFQIRKLAGGRLVMCEDAFFHVDPIESIDRLYTQRQRWQRAQLEVASLFTGDHLGNIVDFLGKPTMRKLISDHTLTFPRLIWFFAMIYLYFINYPLSLLAGANLLLYASYVINSFLYLFAARVYLKKHTAVKKYLLSNWYVCFIVPLYRFAVYWIRIAGTINSLTTESRWRTKTLSEEIGIVRAGIHKNVKSKLGFLDIIKKLINNE